MVNFFIHRPVFASVIAIIMVLTGLIAYGLLPVAQFPDITPPQVVVTATYPGASSQVVASTVTTPLEQQINGVPGMAYMSSVSANDGSSTITVTFRSTLPRSMYKTASPRRRRNCLPSSTRPVSSSPRKTPTSCWGSTSLRRTDRSISSPSATMPICSSSIR
jgi:multidrug efflux pump subunit AcrB